MEWYKDGMYPEWHISGEDFSPKELLHHFPFLILGRTHEKQIFLKKVLVKDKSGDTVVLLLW